MLHNVFRDTKNTQKTKSFSATFGAKTSSKIVDFLKLFPEPCFWRVSGSMFDRFWIDLGVMFGHNSDDIQIKM